jgi:tetratricopeptide (TPR) repeat protein
LDQSDPAAQALRAQVALDQGDRQRAELILAAGPADDPDLAWLRGKLALAQRDAPAAIRQFRIALATHPSHREVLLGLGRALRLAGDQHAAEPYLQAAAHLDRLALLLQDLAVPGSTRDPRRLHELGAVCEELRRYPESRAWYRLALTYDPTASKTREALKRIAHLQGDPDRRSDDRVPRAHDLAPPDGNRQPGHH